jgi:hypothetical protein
VEQSLSEKKYCVGIFLDIEGAYDNITKRNIPLQIINWFQQYMQHRTCEFTIGGETFERELTKGVTQGGVSSPQIYSYPTNDFLEICDREKVQGTGFADDGAILESGHNIIMILHKLQVVLTKIQGWATEVGLTFSISKTKAIIFTRSKIDLSSIPPLKLYDSDISYVTSIKYLGITLDSKATFKLHIQNKFKEAKMKLIQIRNATGKEWGPNPYMMRWLYTGVVRPAITYGCMIWAKASVTKSFKETAQKIQRLALLHMAPFRTKSPTIGLEMLAYLPPRHFYPWGSTKCFHSTLPPSRPIPISKLV